jgi:polyisoprenoid-binding protein YceI
MAHEKSFGTISPQEFRARRELTDPFVLIDTLPPDHFQKMHIPGAANACVFEVVFLDHVNRIAPDKGGEVIVYGSDRETLDAVTAAEKLIRAGYGHVKVLEGGLMQWAASGYELDGEDPAALEAPEPSVSPHDRTYVIDTEESILEWVGRNPNTKHHGTVFLSGGEIVVRDGRIRGRFEIDMKTIRNINLEGDPLQPVLISHLMSDDFFFVERFPKAIFHLQSAEPIAGATSTEPNFQVVGVLELHGVKKEIRFPATASPAEGGEVRIEAHFDMDRTQWDIIYGSARFFKHLGMHLVFDLISIQLRMVAR